MSRVALLMLVCGALAAGQGRPATEAEIKKADFTVLPNGAGLPAGRGTAKLGQAIFKDKCAACHNEKGEGKENQYPALAGGVGSIGGKSPVKTVGSYWPYATTIFDYVRRAMPYDQPRTLSTDQVYSVSAFVLYLNGIVKEDEELNERTLPQVKMPNRDGFVPDARPDVKTKK